MYLSSQGALSAEASSQPQPPQGAAAAATSISSPGGEVKKMGQLGPLVLAGVAAYVGVVYTFWGAFRAYFDWSESLALSFIVRRIIKCGVPR